jgi:hypothetical protein
VVLPQPAKVVLAKPSNQAYSWDMFNPGRPDASEHLAYFSRYINLVPDGPVVELLGTEFERVFSLLSTLTPQQAQHRYAPGKWSVSEMIGHICDTERVFAYRALHAARKDSSPLPGFDQDQWMEPVDFASRALPDLLEEWRGVRSASSGLFSHLSPEAWGYRANVSQNPMTPRACAYIIVGHPVYHLHKLKELYGVI